MAEEQYISCIPPVHQRKARECLQNLNKTYWRNPLHVSCMHAWCPTRRLWVLTLHIRQHRCLVEEAGQPPSAVSCPKFLKPAKISTGYAKYLTNQKRYTIVMSGIYYYQFVISKLYLYIPYLCWSLWQTRKDILQVCREYNIINLLYLSYTYIPYLFHSWWDMP